MALERLLEGMKAVKDIVVETYDNLSLMGKAGYLRLFTAVMPAVGLGCGDTITYNYYNYEGVQAKGCASETDCRDLEQCIYNNDLETNICYDSSGVADYAEGSNGGDDDVGPREFSCREGFEMERDCFVEHVPNAGYNNERLERWVDMCEDSTRENPNLQCWKEYFDCLASFCLNTDWTQVCDDNNLRACDLYICAERFDNTDCDP